MPKECRMPSKQKSKNKLMEPNKQKLETNTTDSRLLRKRTLDSDTIIPASKKKSIQRSIRDHGDINKSAKELLVRPKCNASLLSETGPDLDYMNCPKCFYKCKNPKKFQKHPCNKILENMKSCFVTLNTIPGLDINYNGNFLFFQCRQCSRFFSDGYSYSQHLLTHPKTPTNRSIKTLKLNINGSYSANDDDQMPLDADENTNNNDSNAIFEKSFKYTPSVLHTSNLCSNAPKKSHSICNTFAGNLSSNTKHSCNKISANMKTCAVVLNTFPGLDINTRGNVLFFECNQCSRFFSDGSQHLSTHPKTEFNSNIKTISLNINSSYPTPTKADQLLVDADENINNNNDVVTSLNSDKSTVNNSTLTTKHGNLSGQHLPIHLETQFNGSIETISLNINSSAIDDPMLLDAEENINHNNGNATSLNPDESTVNNSTLNQSSKNGNLSAQHLSTHLETQFNGSIDDPMLVDAEENINNNNGNITFLNLDEGTINNSNLNQTSKNGNSSGQYLSTHPETYFNRNIKTVSPNINSSYPMVDDDPMISDADENINNNVTSVNPDENTIDLTSNVQKKSWKFCSIS